MTFGVSVFHVQSVCVSNSIVSVYTHVFQC